MAAARANRFGLIVVGGPRSFVRPPGVICFTPNQSAPETVAFFERGDLIGSEESTLGDYATDYNRVLVRQSNYRDADLCRELIPTDPALTWQAPLIDRAARRVTGPSRDLHDAARRGAPRDVKRFLQTTSVDPLASLGMSGAAAGSAAATGSRRLLSVVLGASSENARANESQKLLNWGYTAFEAVKLFDANQAVVSPAVWKGKEATVKLGRPQAIIVAVPTGTAGKLKTQVLRPDPLVAPFTKGQQLATLKVTSGEQSLAEVPLLALDAVEQAGVLGRAWDAVRLWIK